MPNIEVTLKPQKGVNNYGADKCKKQKFEEDGYIIVPNLLTQEPETAQQTHDQNQAQCALDSIPSLGLPVMENRQAMPHRNP